MSKIHSCGYYCDRPECIKAQRDELRDKVEALRKDAERMDFLEDPTKCYWVTIQAQPSGGHIRAGQGVGTRAAIDAAMKEEK